MSIIKFLILFFVSTLASAANLTDSEKTLLRTAALAEPSIQSCITVGADVCVADWFNSETTFVVWKTRQNENEIYAQTGFDFTLVDGLTNGKRDEWSNFLFKEGFCNPSKTNIRNGVIDVWSGTAAKNAVQAVILNLFKRNATQAEKILSTGTGTTLSPGTMTFEGNLNAINDIPGIMRP
jgi:hypothetical protein